MALFKTHSSPGQQKVYRLKTKGVSGGTFKLTLKRASEGNGIGEGIKKAMALLGLKDPASN